MRQILYISLFLFSLFSSAQQEDKKTKIIRGFVFEHTIPKYPAEIKIKGTERKVETDVNGKFEIEVRQGDVLIVEVLGNFTSFTFTITDKNCYKIYITPEAGNPFITKKIARIERKNKRKIERKVKRKTKEGFYDCFD